MDDGRGERCDVGAQCQTVARGFGTGSERLDVPKAEVGGLHEQFDEDAEDSTSGCFGVVDMVITSKKTSEN